MHKIGIVEDEGSIAELLKLNLELEGFETEVFDHGGKAARNLDSLINKDLIILDIMLPEVSGLDLCRQIRGVSQVPILMLSAKGATSERITGLKAGANDYLPKPFDLEELLLRVQNLLPQSEQNEVKTWQIGQVQIDFNTYIAHDLTKGENFTLTKREVELLELFKEKEGVVVSRDEILDRLWGKEQFPTARTIDNYILSFRKIFEEDAKHPKHFHSIRGVGYRFTP